MSDLLDLEKYARKVFARLFGSLFFYLAFLGMHLNLIFVQRDAYQAYLSLVPLVLSQLLLPREVMQDAAVRDAPRNETRIRLEKVDRFAMLLRAAYLLLAFVVLLLLPRLIPAPTP
jgi:hypothetical protein